MQQMMLVATAGHIDHGKTALIRALTGVETDRLPEEKARGISIDLGFAYWTPAEGEPTIGFVDVPGHERFIRNMLAGVAAVEVALLVVAADDGVMPQTVEHAQMLDMLGIVRGFVAITKCDRVPPERVAAVRAEVEALLAPTRLRDAAWFAVSAHAGLGIAELGTALRDAARDRPARDTGDRNLRFAIDRAFSVTGAGTVVTGTVIEGSLTAGARLLISPRELPARVRGLQSAGRTITAVSAGERCAVNLSGVEVAAVQRGDWLTEPGTLPPTIRMEARVTALAARQTSLKHNTPVHLHIGTADIAAHLLMPRARPIAPGTEGVAQIVLDRPTCAVVGDRFVLRDGSGQHLLGGGTVIDPHMPADRRRQAGRAAVTPAFQRGEPAAALAMLLATPGHEVDTAHFAHSFNLRSAAADALYAGSDAVLLGRARALALPAERIARLGTAITAALDARHRDRPEEGGVTVRALRQAMPEAISADAFGALLKRLAEQRLIAFSGALARRPDHAPGFSLEEQALWQRLIRWGEARGPLPFSAADAARELRVNEAATGALLHRRRLSGELWRVSERRFLLRDHLTTLATAAAALADGPETGFTAAEYRDATGLGRNFVIQLLEFLDAIGVTVRSGDRRIVRADYRNAIGADD